MKCYRHAARHAVAAIAVLTGLASLTCLDSGGTRPSPACPYAGITSTDAAGNILSDDTSDWCPFPRYGIAWAWALYPAVPNPARVSTTIEFGVLSGGMVEIEIKDCSSRTVRAFHGNAATYTVVWDLTDASGRRVPPGLYRCFYQVTYPHAVYGCSGDIEVLAP
jgi:hypothetical protein